jgi:hypothetical protein
MAKGHFYMVMVQGDLMRECIEERRSTYALAALLPSGRALIPKAVIFSGVLWLYYEEVV